MILIEHDPDQRAIDVIELDKLLTGQDWKIKVRAGMDGLFVDCSRFATPSELAECGIPGGMFKGRPITFVERTERG